MENGLNCNTVISILEDKSANIWFGTRDGLCRYDGKILSFFPSIKTLRLLLKAITIIILSNQQRKKCGVCYKIKKERFGSAPGMVFIATMEKLLPIF